eukprot:704334-Alexandrium_andersonii.AAC.1
MPTTPPGTGSSPHRPRRRPRNPHRRTRALPRSRPALPRPPGGNAHARPTARSPSVRRPSP